QGAWARSAADAAGTRRSCDRVILKVRFWPKADAWLSWQSNTIKNIFLLLRVRSLWQHSAGASSTVASSPCGMRDSVMKPKLFAVFAIVGTLGSFLSLTGAHASTVYTYAGNPYAHTTDQNPPSGAYTLSMSVNGSFETATLPANLGSVSLFDISGLLISF